MSACVVNVRGFGPGGWVRRLQVDGNLVSRSADWLYMRFMSGASMGRIAAENGVHRGDIEDLVRFYCGRPDIARKALKID